MGKLEDIFNKYHPTLPPLPLEAAANITVYDAIQEEWDAMYPEPDVAGQHTPGPYFYDQRTESIGCPAGWIARIEHTSKADGTFGHPDADGYLLAAALLLLAALERIEWVGEGRHGPWCPWCGSYQQSGHDSGCNRTAAIAAAKGEA